MRNRERNTFATFCLRFSQFAEVTHLELGALNRRRVSNFEILQLISGVQNTIWIASTSDSLPEISQTRAFSSDA